MKEDIFYIHIISRKGNDYRKEKGKFVWFLPILQLKHSEKFCSFRIELKYYKNTFNSTDC